MFRVRLLALDGLFSQITEVHPVFNGIVVEVMQRSSVWRVVSSEVPPLDVFVNVVTTELVQRHCRYIPCRKVSLPLLNIPVHSDEAFS